jgi:hypothetical protein
MIKSKFNGYSRDGIRLYNDPGTAAAFVAGMSKATAAAAPAAFTAGGLGTGTMAGTMLSGTGAVLGNTAALGASSTAALGTAGGAAAPTMAAIAPQLAAPAAAGATELSAVMPEVASNLAAAGGSGSTAAQGIMQGAQGASTVPSAAPAIPGAAPPVLPPPAGAGPAAPIDPFRAAPPAGNPVNPFANNPVIQSSPAIGEPAAGGPPNIMDALSDGFMKAMKYASDNPLSTSIGLFSAQKLLGGDEESGGRKSGKSGQSVDLSNFTPSSPSPYLYGFADGGAVPNLPMNTVGGNANYPMSQQRVSTYTRPSVQNPVAQNVLDVSGSGALDPYTGMPTYAGGGRVKNKESFYEQVMREDEERMAQARRSMSAHTPDVSGSGIFRRTLAQEQGRPDQVAASQFAQAAKRAGVKVIEMPKANMPEDFTYEAASGGIMRAADGGTMGKIPPPPPPPPAGARPVSQMPGALIRPSGFGAAPVAAPVARPAPVAAPVARPTPVARPAPAAGPAPVSQAIVNKYSKAFGPQTMAFLNSSAYQGPRMAEGGIATGLGGYSDGGRLLKGPGDGVSDSIPAVIGKRQPARLADGEFVIPARIVSELGNGSTEAGARQLYAMMERIQKRRKKSVGKGKVAVDSKSHKDLPA